MKNLAGNSVFEAVAKYSAISLDTMDVEPKQYFSSEYDIQFLNTTSNQAICFSNWNSHPQNVAKAIEIVNKTRASASLPVPKSAADVSQEYIDEIIIQATAITGSLQLPGIKGRILSQILPSLCGNADNVYDYAKAIIKAYENIAVDKSRVIIKIPITWESMQAAKKLQSEGISCLGTVCHSLEQAVLAAEANCVAISPYVDELKYNLDPSNYVPQPLSENYGFHLVEKVHKYYRAYGIKTINCIAATIGLDVIMSLSGVDEMTIPVVSLNKMIHTSVPEGQNFPGLKASYTKEEAGPELSFINDKEAYEKAFNKIPEAVARTQEATDVFVGFYDKSIVLVKNALVEYGHVSH